MADVLLFHHAQGLTAGCLSFAADPRRRPRRPRPGSLRRQDLRHARRRHRLRRAGRLRHDHGARPTSRRRPAERDRLRRLLARGHAGSDAGPDAPRREGSRAVPRRRPDVRVRRRVAAGVPLQIHIMDADELAVREGDLDSPTSSPRRSRAQSCSCTRATGTYSPTTACPTSTRAPRRCSGNACSAASTTSGSGERSEARQRLRGSRRGACGRAASCGSRPRWRRQRG